MPLGVAVILNRHWYRWFSGIRFVFRIARAQLFEYTFQPDSGAAVFILRWGRADRLTSNDILILTLIEVFPALGPTVQRESLACVPVATG